MRDQACHVTPDLRPSADGLVVADDVVETFPAGAAGSASWADAGAIRHLSSAPWPLSPGARWATRKLALPLNSPLSGW